MFNRSEKWFVNVPTKKLCIFQPSWHNHQEDLSKGLAATISITKMVGKHSNESCGESWSHGFVSVLCVSLSLSLFLKILSAHTHFSTLILYMAASGKCQTQWGALFRNLKAIKDHSRFARPGVWLLPIPFWGATKFFGFLVIDTTTSLFTSRRPTAVNFNSPVQVLSHCQFLQQPVRLGVRSVSPLLIFLLAWRKITSN